MLLAVLLLHVTQVSIPVWCQKQDNTVYHWGLLLPWLRVVYGPSNSEPPHLRVTLFAPVSLAIHVAILGVLVLVMYMCYTVRGNTSETPFRDGFEFAAASRRGDNEPEDLRR